MMHPSPRVTALLLAFALASCAARDGATALVPDSSSGQNAAFALHGVEKTGVVLRIVVPRPAQHPRSRYISPSTQALVFVVSQNDTPVAGGSGYANLTPSSPQCRGGSGSTPLVCMVNVPLIVSGSGNFTFALATFDATQSGPPAQAPCALPDTNGCAGDALSQNVVVQSLTQGIVNTVAFTLGGIPAGLTVTPISPGYLRGGGNPPKLDLWGREAQEVLVQARDAGGNAIVGPGAPSYSVTSANPSQLTVSAAGSQTNLIALQAVTSGSPPVVTPGVVDLNVVVTPAAGGGPAVPFGVPVTIAHSIVYVSTLLDGVKGYYDNNVTPSAEIKKLLWVDLQGIAVAGNGELYIANPVGEDVIACPSGSTSSRSCRRVFDGVGVAVGGLTIDRHGVLYIATASRVLRCPPGSTSVRACGELKFDGPRDVAVDENGAISIVSSQNRALKNGVWSCPPGSTVERQCAKTAVSGMKHFAYGVAVNADAGYVASFALFGGGTVMECSLRWRGCTVAYSGDKPRGIALGASGLLYVADSAADRIVVCSPQPNSCRSLLNVRHPSYVTLVPAPL
jgi:hypothetical protein